MAYSLGSHGVKKVVLIDKIMQDSETRTDAVYGWKIDHVFGVER